MAMEWWTSPPASAVPCRRQSCGHRVDLSPPFISEIGCLQCGDAVPFLGGPASRDYVPSVASSAASTWAWAACTKRRLLETDQTGAPRSLEGLVAAISSPGAHTLHLRGGHVRTQHRPAPGAASFLVWRAATAGCTVRSGTVELPEEGVLLLTGRGTHFHGTSFMGGVIICDGANFSGSFQNCTFYFATVYAVHGAAATLRGCRIIAAHPGLVASGAATVATLSGCDFRDCKGSVIVERGAELAADACVFSRTDTGVSVNDPGSHASLQSCELHGGLSHTLGGHAVTISSAAVSLKDCHVSNFISGVYGLEGVCMAEACRVLVEDVALGAMFGCRSKATLRQCSISSQVQRELPIRPLAVFAGPFKGPRYDGRARVQLERCNVNGGPVPGGGVMSSRGSAVAAVLCRIRSGENTLAVNLGGRAVMTHCRGVAQRQCVVVMSDGVLRLLGGRYSGQSACGAVDGARVLAKRCDFSSGRDPQQMGLLTAHGSATLRLFRCCVHDSVLGVCCDGGASVTSVGTTVRNMHREEAASHRGGFGYLCMSGEMVVQGGTVDGCAVCMVASDEMAEPSADRPRAVLRVSGVMCTNCVEGMRCALRGCEAHASQCEFHGLAKGPRAEAASKIAAAWTDQVDRVEAGVSFAGCAAGHIEHCTLSGFPVSVVADSPASIRIESCSFLGSAQSSGWTHVEARGSAEIIDCSFKGAAGVQWSGVAVSAEASCVVRGCRMSGLGGTAVEAFDGSTVKVLQTDIDDCCEGVKVGDGSEVAMQDCQVAEVKLGLGVRDARGTCSAKRVSIRAEDYCVYVSRGSQPREVVKLVDCALSGGDVGVCVLGDLSAAPVSAGSDSVAVSMLRCQLVDCDGAVKLRGPVSCRMKACSVAGCMSGLIVGGNPDGLTHVCAACGRSGERAIKRSLDALLGTGGEAARARARCRHEGAVARLTLEEVRVTDCEEVGIVASEHGCVDAVRVEVARCKEGIYVSRLAGAAHRSVFSLCVVAGAQSAAVEAVETPETMMQADDPVRKRASIRGVYAV